MVRKFFGWVVAVAGLLLAALGAGTNDKAVEVGMQSTAVGGDLLLIFGAFCFILGLLVLIWEQHSSAKRTRTNWKYSAEETEYFPEKVSPGSPGSVPYEYLRQ